MAGALAALDRRTEAHQCYEMALQLAPDEPRTHFALGQLLVVEKRFPEAVQHSRRCCEPPRKWPRRIRSWLAH